MSNVKVIIQKVKLIKPRGFLKKRKNTPVSIKVIDKKRLRKVREKRRVEEEKRTKRNFLPTLLLTFVLWFGLGLFVYFIDPASFGALPAFFVLGFLALLFTFSVILGDTKKGFAISTGILVFLALRLFGLGNVLNLLLIAGIVASIIVYFGGKRA